MRFQSIHIYDGSVIKAQAAIHIISKIFPKCTVDIRPPFMHHDDIQQARILDIKQPFEKQPKRSDLSVSLYDGFLLQRIYSDAIPSEEADHVHIIFTDILTCTFSEDDWRYHARTVICGMPSIISSSGIIEAPAKARDFYFAQLGFGPNDSRMKEKFSGEFIDCGDDKIDSAAAIYALQALFFYVTNGDPFCEDKNCMLFNAHWQKELLNMINRRALCTKHNKIANKFNNIKLSSRKSFYR